MAQALEKRLDKADFTVDQSLAEVAAMARAKVEKVTATDKLAANKLFLQAKGALTDKRQESRIIVHFGVLASLAGQSAANITITESNAVDAVVMAPQPQVSRPGECGVLDGGVKD